MNNLAVVHCIKSRFWFKTQTFIHCVASCKLNLNLVRKRNCSNHTFNYHTEIAAAINEQIKREHGAAMDYLDMAINLLHPNVSYVGAGSYFMKMYKEELHHMEVLLKYQLTRGGEPKVNIEEKSIGASKKDLNLVAAFSQALEMEREITKHLQNIVSKAEALKDYQCADFITSKFMEEQIHSLHELSHHVTILNRLCGNEQASWLYDQKLLQKYKHENQ